MKLYFFMLPCFADERDARWDVEWPGRESARWNQCSGLGKAVDPRGDAAEQRKLVTCSRLRGNIKKIYIYLNTP